VTGWETAQSSTGLDLSITLRRQSPSDVTEPILISYLDGLIALEQRNPRAALQLLCSVVERDTRSQYTSAKVLACLLSLQLGDGDSFEALKDACFANDPPDAFARRIVSASTLRLCVDGSPVGATFPGVLANSLQAAQFAVGGSLLAHNELEAAATALQDVKGPLQAPRLVLLSDLLDEPQSPLVFPLGFDVHGQATHCDLRAMPHLLVAGEAGAGKSTMLNAMLCSFLTRFPPDQVALVLIDLSMVELAPYEGIPHLLAPVADNAEQGLHRLRATEKMMNMRYTVAKDFGVRSFLELNERLERDGHERCPYVVCIVDELAELIRVSRKSVVDAVAQIAQKGTAVGIHLVLATRFPRDCFPQLMKAAAMSRIALRLPSETDSRAFLGRGGAEGLLGAGDMMYLPTGTSSPTRLQGCLASSDAVGHLCKHWRAQARSSDSSAGASSADADAEPTLPSIADVFALDEPRQLDERMPPSGIDETLCWIYAQLGQHDRVLDVVSRHPSPRLNMWKAAALATSGLRDAALVVYDDCIRDGDNLQFSCEARYAKARLLLENGNEPSARRELARIYADFPGFADSDGLLAKLDTSRPASTREPIPEAIRHAVWRRDEGRCVECGSQDALEFDHLIPYSRGGANTERNLQLLCERCNRKKGATV